MRTLMTLGAAVDGWFVVALVVYAIGDALFVLWRRRRAGGPRNA